MLFIRHLSEFPKFNSLYDKVCFLMLNLIQNINLLKINLFDFLLNFLEHFSSSMFASGKNSIEEFYMLKNNSLDFYLL